MIRMKGFSLLVHAAQYHTCEIRIPSRIRLMTYLSISEEHLKNDQLKELTP